MYILSICYQMREKRANMPWTSRDWKTCFLACGFSLEERESDTFRSSSSPEVPRKKLAFHSKKRIHSNKTNGKQNQSKASIKCSAKVPKTRQIQKVPSFRDEDFIVFRHTNDGLIHVINNDRDGHIIRSSKRNVRTKIILGEDEDNVYPSTSDRPLVEDERNRFTTDEVKLKWRSKETEAVHRISKEGGNHEDNEACKTTSGEQSETTQSDGSSSSFAFPELNWEEIGSPKQMCSGDPYQWLTRQNAYTVLSRSCRF